MDFCGTFSPLKALHHLLWLLIYFFFFCVCVSCQDLDPSPCVLDCWVNPAPGCLRRPVQSPCSLLIAARGAVISPPKQVRACRMRTNLCSQSKQSLRNKSTRGGRVHSKDSQKLSLEYLFFYVLGASFSRIQAGFQGIICQLQPSLREDRTVLPFCLPWKAQGTHSKEFCLGGEPVFPAASLLWGFGWWQSWCQAPACCPSLCSPPTPRIPLALKPKGKVGGLAESVSREEKDFSVSSSNWETKTPSMR